MKAIHKYRWELEVEQGRPDLVGVRCGRDAHREFSRKFWNGVTCKDCLRLKGKVDGDGWMKDVSMIVSVPASS